MRHPAFLVHNVIGNIKNPVLDNVEWDVRRTHSARWIDLVHGRVWTSSMPLRPLLYRDHPMMTLALDDRSAQAPVLFVLDFTAGVQRQRGILNACEGQVREWGRRGQKIILTCQRQPQANLYVFDRVWTAMVDLNQGRIGYTDLQPEELLPNGELLASDRKQSAAESSVTFQKLYRLSMSQ